MLLVSLYLISQDRQCCLTTLLPLVLKGGVVMLDFAALLVHRLSRNCPHWEEVLLDDILVLL